MIITVGKVKVFIVPKLKYAALFEKATNRCFYDMFDSDYSRLLKSVFIIARRKNN